MKILVVDDEMAMVRLFEQRFRREIRDGRIEFVFAHSGEAALEYFETSKSDVVMILSDINMPGMSGLELLKRLREMGMDQPIYMISAYENEEYQHRSKEYGATDFLPKPLDFDIIRRLVFSE